MSNPVPVVVMDAAYKGPQDTAGDLRSGFLIVSSLPPIPLGQIYVLLPAGQSTLEDVHGAIPGATIIQVDPPDDLSKPTVEREGRPAVRVSADELRALIERVSIEVVQTFPAHAAQDLPNRSQLVSKGDEGPDLLVLAA